MGLLNIDNISLMAFSTEDVIEQWRAEVEANERNKTQVVTITEHENTHTDTYTRTDHTDYTRLAGGSLERGVFGATDEIVRASVYVPKGLSRVSEHTDRYSRTNQYTDTAHTNRYSDVAHTNRYTDRYTRVSHTNRYSRYARRDKYTRVARRNSYSDRYSRVAARDRYTRVAARDRYARADLYTDYTKYSRGFTAEKPVGYTDDGAGLVYYDPSEYERDIYTKDGVYTRTAAGYSQENANILDDGYVQYNRKGYTQYPNSTYAQYGDRATSADGYEASRYNQYARADYNQYTKANYLQYARADYDQYADSRYSESVSDAENTRNGTQDYTQGGVYIRSDMYSRDHENTVTYDKDIDSYGDTTTYYDKEVTDVDASRYYEKTYNPITGEVIDYTKYLLTETGYTDERRVGDYAQRIDLTRAYNEFVENPDGTYTYGQYTPSGYYTGEAYTEYIPAYRQYSRVSYTYTRVEARDIYTRTGYDKGFDHTNYVPSSPEVYDLEGNVISGTLDIYLASYDANNDGLGSQDQESKDIYYTVKIRQTHDLTGAEVNGEWIVLQEGAKTDGLNVDISGYEDGIYELSTQAYNSPKSEKDVSKTYVSEEKISTFTISDGGIGSTSTVLNAEEFYDYIYGLETYSDREGQISKYVDSIIYKDERLEEIGGSQKGLFMVIGLTDEDIDTYHKTTVSLEKNNTIIAKDYEVVYETNADGTPKAGNKEGVVFIPLEDMLDDGSFNDVRVMLTTTEYSDAGMTQQKGEKEAVHGVAETGAAVFVDLDAHNPNIFISEPKEAIVLNVDVSVSDIGSGLLGGETYYQITDKGEEVQESAWQKVEGGNTNFTLPLNNPGTYDIYVKVKDKAGNETMGGKGGYVVLQEGAIVEAPDKARKGETVTIKATVVSDDTVTDRKFWVDGYGDPVEGIDNGDGTYTAEITLPSNIPLGQHDIYFEATCGTKTLTATDTLLIVEDKVTISAPSTANPDSIIDVSATVDSDREVTKTEFWLEDEDGNVLGDKTEGMKGENGDYTTSVVIPEDIEEGIIKIVVEVTFSDGTTVRTEKTLLIISEGITSDDGIRFISKDYIYTIDENGNWTKEELEEIFDNDEPIYEEDI